MRMYSIFWARLLGFYTLILASWYLCERQNAFAAVLSLINNPATTAVLGMFTLFLGLAMVANHQVWKGWPIIITLLGYWITFKGILLLFFPAWAGQVMTFWQNIHVYWAVLPSLIVSFALLFCGFFLKKRN